MRFHLCQHHCLHGIDFGLHFFLLLFHLPSLFVQGDLQEFVFVDGGCFAGFGCHEFDEEGFVRGKCVRWSGEYGL